MFEQIPMAPPDSIYHLTTACNLDANPRKLNLGVGVFKDETGHIPVLEVVKEAERRIWEQEDTKNYLPIDGSRTFGLQVRRLLLGQDSAQAGAPGSITVQTPGGTGALRLAMELIARQLPGARMWISNPTWPNHAQMCGQAGIEVQTYPYGNEAGNALAEADFFACLEQIPAGDVLMLHGCCHNPTGLDLDAGQWERAIDIAAQRNLLLLVDIAYQGFGRGLAEDADGVRRIARAGLPQLVCSSYSKNFGLYSERVGALTCLGFDEDVSARLQSQLKVMARTLWSSPPVHGARIVETVLGDAALRARWEQELGGMRDRINDMRSLLAETMHGLGVTEDFSFITRQYGLFSLTGIAPEVNRIMRERDSIYFMTTGRINVAGLTPETVDYFCRAFHAATA